jgi:DNA-binding SARP family transcriptional activator
MYEPWCIELFGGLRAIQGDTAFTRFRTQKTAALLAFLALYQKRAHAREELVERFWPDKEPEAGRTNLRATLAALRRQLEPSGTAMGSVLVADRMNVGLNPAAVQVDVAAYEAALDAANRADADPGRRLSFLVQAADLYRGELLPGFYEDWVLTERERLAQVHLHTLRQLSDLLGQAGDVARAVDYAHRAVQTDPLQEESWIALMRLLLAAGQPTVALRRYAELERVLREELDDVPSSAARALADQARQADEGTSSSSSRRTRSSSA